MPSASLVSASVAGGLVAGPGAIGRLIIEGFDLSLFGDLIEPHGLSPHNAAVMVEACTTFFVTGILACRVGDLASCGHPVANGAATFFIEA